MIGMTLIKPALIAAVQATGSAPGNLLSPDPKEVWTATNTSNVSIFLDLGEEVQFDALFLGFSNAAAGATIAVSRTATLGGTVTAEISPSRAFRMQGGGPRYHHYQTFNNMVSARYLRLLINQANPAAPINIGTLIIGQRLVLPYEYRSGRRPIDLSQITETISGGYGIDRRAIKSSFRFTLAGINDVDLDRLWAMVSEVGQSGPLIGVEGHEDNPRYDQLHYGLFGTLEPYEREDAQDTRWGLVINDWI